MYAATKNQILSYHIIISRVLKIKSDHITSNFKDYQPCTITFNWSVGLQSNPILSKSSLSENQNMVCFTWAITAPCPCKESTLKTSYITVSKI